SLQLVGEVLCGNPFPLILAPASPTDPYAGGGGGMGVRRGECINISAVSALVSIHHITPSSSSSSAWSPPPRFIAVANAEEAVGSAPLPPQMKHRFKAYEMIN